MGSAAEAAAAGDDVAHAQQQQQQQQQGEQVLDKISDGAGEQQHVDYSIPLKGSGEDSSASASASASAPTNAHASSNNPAISALEKRMGAELPFQTSELSTFDACIEAADAMAANDSGRAPTSSSSSASGGTDSGRGDRSDGATDCSVLVSPDGALLFLPRQDSADGTHEIIDGLHSQQNMQLLTNMYPTEEVRSAIVTGSDLHPSGDRLANGFSVRGWSDDAASLALRRSDEALRATATFIRGLDHIHREEAARIGGTVCNEFRRSVICSSDSRRTAPVSAKKSKFGRQRSVPKDDPNADECCGGDVDAMISSSFSRENKLKTSPLFFPGSTLHAAAASLIQYHTTAMGSAGSTRMGPSPSTASQESVARLQFSAERTAHRAANREAALTRAHRRVEEMEAVLLLRRQEAQSRWNAVERLEEKVQKEYERRVRERSRELYNRKRQSEDHLSHLKDDADGDGFGGNHDGGIGGDAAGGKPLNTGVTETELWQLVNQIGNEEDSSFHPLGLPEAPPRPPTDKSLVDRDDEDNDHDEEGDDEEEFENDGSVPSSTVPSSSASPILDHSMLHPPLPPIDRGDVEFEMNLPPLRAAALEAESEVEHAATNVLNAISALDTTERSARIAAESALLSAANAQAEAMKSMVQQERLVLEARLKQLDVLDRQVNSLDVRADLDAFIAFDRRERPGSATRLGEDDDGGVAAALAVLDGHAEGADGGLGASASATSLSSFERFGGAEDTVTADEDRKQNDKHKGIALSREEIDKVVAALFAERSNEDDGAEDLDDAGSLVLAVSLRSSRGRSCRASTCYALNKQRSIKTEVATNEQFDGLCRVFYALLKGCDARVPSDVANAKMCMMLSQTFYVVDHDDVFGDGEVNTSGEISDERKRRLYVKATLVNHPFFSQEDFWVQALFQCVTESLAGSGVVSLNFDTQSSSGETSMPSLRRDRDSDSIERRQRKWYELNGQERAEAASQVHAVIFAQLGALSHSMLEFGCEQSVAVAFVRRCSVQHQLPLSQRTMLLQHLIGRRNSSAVSNVTPKDQATGSDNEELDAPISEEDCVDKGDGDGENEDENEHNDEVGPPIDDPFKSTCTDEPVPGSNRLVALLSRGVSDRTQSAHQQHCLAILKARKTPYCVVDGMDPRQKARRDELFLVSGKRGHYPQFFLLTYDNAGNEAGAMFLGGFDRLKDLNDTVDLSEDILQANPELETWTRLLGECK